MTNPKPLTEERLSAIEARAKAATPDWECKDSPEAPFDGQYRVLGKVRVAPPKHFDDREWAGWFHKYENALFAAHARQDVPALVAEVRRLRSALQSIVDNAWYVNEPGGRVYELGERAKYALDGKEWCSRD